MSEPPDKPFIRPVILPDGGFMQQAFKTYMAITKLKPSSSGGSPWGSTSSTPSTPNQSFIRPPKPTSINPNDLPDGSFLKQAFKTYMAITKLKLSSSGGSPWGATSSASTTSNQSFIGPPKSTSINPDDLPDGNFLKQAFETYKAISAIPLRGSTFISQATSTPTPLSSNLAQAKQSTWGQSAATKASAGVVSSSPSLSADTPESQYTQATWDLYHKAFEIFSAKAKSGSALTNEDVKAIFQLYDETGFTSPPRTWAGLLADVYESNNHSFTDHGKARELRIQTASRPNGLLEAYKLAISYLQPPPGGRVDNKRAVYWLAHALGRFDEARDL